MKLKVAGITDIGLLRNQNEDSYVIDEKLGLFIIADGLGGHNGGNVASRLAVDVIVSALKGMPAGQIWKEDDNKGIELLINRAHQAILDVSSGNHSLKGMGTTIVFALFSPPAKLLLANVGDSRAYLYRRNTLTQLTYDHSVAADLVRQGIIAPEESRFHRLRNVLTQSLGTVSKVDLYRMVLKLEENDVILLCSDGLWDMLSDADIKAIISQNNTPQEICMNLIEAAKDVGGRDNITTITIIVKSDGV